MPFCTNGIDDMFEPHAWNLREFSDDCFKQWSVRPRPAWIITTVLLARSLEVRHMKQWIRNFYASLRKKH